jgi:uncharacterized RDD family membrane protein YckC
MNGFEHCKPTGIARMRTKESKSRRRTDVAPPGSQAGVRPCGLLRLLMVMVYDAIVVVAILMVAGAIALELPFEHQAAGKDPAYTVYLLLAWFLYLAWCWRHGGMTLGMRAWSVRLLNGRTDGSNPVPGWGQCGLRFVGAWLSAAPAGLGYLWMLIDREKRSWHDRLSQTQLVHFGKTLARPPSGRPPEEPDSGQAE